MRLRGTQIIAATTFFVLVLWLLFSGSQKTVLAGQIRDGLAKKTIGNIDAEATAFLEDIVSIGLRISGQKAEFSINRLDSPATLRVFSYNSQIDHPLNFGAGNAVYDASADAIFLDESLINPRIILGMSDNLAATEQVRLRGLLLFLISHELAHRALHAGLDGVTNVGAISGEGDTSIETEADEYAMRALRNNWVQLQQEDRYWTLNEETAGTIGLESKQYDGIEAMYVMIAAMFWDAAQVYVIGRTPFPPHFSDHAHPPLTQRIIRLLENQVLFDELNDELKAHRATLVEWFSRLQAAQHQKEREIYVDQPISAASFIRDKWILISATAYGFVEDRVLRNDSNRRENTSVNWISLPAEARKIVEVGIPHVFQARDGKLYLTDVRTSHIVPLEAGNSDVIQPPLTKEFCFIPAQPANWILCEGDGAYSIFDGQWRTFSLDDLERQIESRFGIEEVRLDFTNVGQDFIAAAVLPAKIDDRRMLGWVTFSVKDSLTISDGEIFSHPPMYKHKVAFVCGDMDPVFLYLLTGNDSDRKFTILDRFGNVEKTSEIITHDYPLRGTKLWMSYPPIYSAGAAYCPGGFILIMYANDSVYLIDKVGSQTVAMHPASLLNPIYDGRCAMVPHMNSHTVYILNPSKSRIQNSIE